MGCEDQGLHFLNCLILVIGYLKVVSEKLYLSDAIVGSDQEKKTIQEEEDELNGIAESLRGHALSAMFHHVDLFWNT